jgi:hypothetical protein
VIQDSGELKLRQADIDFELAGVKVHAPGVDLGTESDNGNNRIKHDPPGCMGVNGEVQGECLAVPHPTIPILPRVVNQVLSLMPMNAVGNNWGDCVCDILLADPPSCPCAEELFTGAGGVLWQPYIQGGFCCQGPGGGFTFVASSGNMETTFSIYPNPGNATFSIEFSFSEGEPKPVASIYDITGREIAVLGAGEYNESTVVWSWDGTNCSGTRQSSGVYFLQVKQAGKTYNKKVVLLK